MSLAVRRGLIALLAVLFAEAVWIITVPPFRGSDEIDHVYRASGVASGQIHLSQGAAHGRGTLVWVPTDIVKAAQEQCDSLVYVGSDNCHAVQTAGGRSLVATAAAGYEPTFYMLVGTAAKPFHGAAADYAMRATTALLCALLLALGVGVMSFAGTDRWVNLGILAALTPEVLFSGAIPSPNGVEMGLAFVLWAALLVAIRRGEDHRLQRGMLVVAGVAAFPLTFLRLLGPMWIVLIVSAVAAVAGLGTTRDLVRRHLPVVCVVAVTTLAGVMWWRVWQVIASHATASQSQPDSKNWLLAFNLPAWTMQMVGAFPFRDEPAPFWIYPLSFFVIGLLVWAAWRRGAERRTRRAVLGIAMVTLLVPVVLSVLYMPSAGAVWQGRYELPFVIGFLPLCGLVLDDVGFAPVEGSRLRALSYVFLVIPQVVCVYHVQQLELARPESAGDPNWWHPPGVVLGVFMLVACAVAVQLTRQKDGSGPLSSVDESARVGTPS
ncbi:MAG TPA: DUF2142 domain-containing protein [Nocardioides sp.]|uniref:DUF2142 domain-containing protein n=1 Tax=Nocardioides sp. TaxID=35761 RepID=UPI002F3E33AA